jgi:hypothetical protein
MYLFVDEVRRLIECQHKTNSQCRLCHSEISVANDHSRSLATYEYSSSKSEKKKGHHEGNGKPLNEEQNYIKRFISTARIATNYCGKQDWNEIQH